MYAEVAMLAVAWKRGSIRRLRPRNHKLDRRVLAYRTSTLIAVQAMLRADERTLCAGLADSYGGHSTPNTTTGHAGRLHGACLEWPVLK